MKNICAALAALIGLVLCAAPVLAKKCGNGVVDRGEQCEVPVSQPSQLDAACPGMCNAKCKCQFSAKTSNIPSKAKPANCPGTKGVVVDNAKLKTQFGKKPNLNKARYTRFRLTGYKGKPDAILILIPGFEGGANNFRILAQNLLKRMSQAPYSKHIEVWAFDRRTNQLEDTKGLDLAEKLHDPILGIDWLFGNELSWGLDRRLPRRAVFYDQSDVPFMANWTDLVFSQDIDAVVQKALKQTKKTGGNVFLGGHSMGTVFTTRYASTDFNITRDRAGNLVCNGTPKPGYENLRGLVLLEGNGWGFATSTTVPPPPLSEDSLERIIAKADGGLYAALAHNEGSCVDGTHPCTIANEETACAAAVDPVTGEDNSKCTLPTQAYATVSFAGVSAVNPRIDAQAEPLAIQAISDLNTNEGVTATSGALDIVHDLLALKIGIPHSTVEGGFGSFLDKDSPNAAVAPFLAMSLGEPGPWVGSSCPSPIPTGYMGSSTCLLTWKDILNGGSPPSSPVLFGPANAAVNAECTGSGTPYACCTGAGEGTCNANVECIDVNAECTDSGEPWACCTGAGAGTCTGGAPWACCTGAGTGNCDVNAECTESATPYACCTGAGTGTCTPNARCTGSSTPVACCTGDGTGTCDEPTAPIPMHKWGQDKEVTRLDRVLSAFMAGKTNFTDWYFPTAGPSTTNVDGVCDSDTHTCKAGGSVSGSCSVDADCSQAIILDSTQLSSPSSGKGRCDIENLTQAGNINIPVIGFSGSQGLATTPGVYLPLAESIGKCTAPSCDGSTPRVNDAGTPGATPPAYNDAFPDFGDVLGGYEVYVSEGYSHLDVCTAEDTRNDECTASGTPYPCCTGSGTGTCVNNNVVKPLADFIARNIIPPS